MVYNLSLEEKMNTEKTFASYLHLKHMEYCNKKGRIFTASEWVLDVLNSRLPPGDGLSNGPVNQWMNGGRNPDSKNIIRLIRVFGSEVMPYLGISIAGELGFLLECWDDLSEEDRMVIQDIIKRNCPKYKTLQA